MATRANPRATSRAAPQVAKRSDTSNETARANGGIDSVHGGSRSALEHVWRLADEIERELHLARFEYPPDQRRIDRLIERRDRLLFKLLPYDDLQPVPQPARFEVDLSKLTDRELSVFDRLCKKIWQPVQPERDEGRKLGTSACRSSHSSGPVPKTRQEESENRSADARRQRLGDRRLHPMDWRPVRGR
jgi:hypothetical protein